MTVHSSLQAVGLTAAVSGKLAAKGIPANVVAGFYHDHLFVPSERVQEALMVLKGLSESGKKRSLPDYQTVRAIKKIEHQGD